MPHIFKTLPKDDKRQTETLDRATCTRCGTLRSPRFGGGYVYAETGWPRGPWDSKRPRCVASRPEEGSR